MGYAEIFKMPSSSNTHAIGFNLSRCFLIRSLIHKSYNKQSSNHKLLILVDGFNALNKELSFLNLFRLHDKTYQDLK